MSTLTYFAPESLEPYVHQVFLALGADDDISREVARHLIRANLSGHDSHGVMRVAQYVKQMDAGDLHPTTRPEVLREAGSTALVDAKRGMGHFSTRFALDSAGRVYVADRENSRVQIFSAEGEFITEWTHVSRPMQVFIDSADNVYVAEVGRKAGLFPWQEAGPNPTGGRVSILTTNGEIVTRWGNGDNPGTPGDFFAPHDICIDSAGSIYVGEVVWSAGGRDGVVPATCPALHKFVRA